MIFAVVFILVVIGLLTGAAGASGAILGLFMLAVFACLCLLAVSRGHRRS